MLPSSSPIAVVRGRNQWGVMDRMSPEQGHPQKERDTVGFRDEIMGKMVYSKTKKRPKELSPREMVVEELNKQRELLASGQSKGSWWDKENDCVTVTVRGATYFNEKSEGGLSGRLYGDQMLGDGKKWSKASVGAFIKKFETALHNDEFVNDTAWWHRRYNSKVGGRKKK